MNVVNAGTWRAQYNDIPMGVESKPGLGGGERYLSFVESGLRAQHLNPQRRHIRDWFLLLGVVPSASVPLGTLSRDSVQSEGMNDSVGHSLLEITNRGIVRLVEH